MYIYVYMYIYIYIYIYISPFLQRCKFIYFTSLTQHTATIGLISLSTVIFTIYKQCVL